MYINIFKVINKYVNIRTMVYNGENSYIRVQIKLLYIYVYVWRMTYHRVRGGNGRSVQQSPAASNVGVGSASSELFPCTVRGPRHPVCLRWMLVQRGTTSKWISRRCLSIVQELSCKLFQRRSILAIEESVHGELILMHAFTLFLKKKKESSSSTYFHCCSVVATVGLTDYQDGSIGRILFLSPLGLVSLRNHACQRVRTSTAATRWSLLCGWGMSRHWRRWQSAWQPGKETKQGRSARWRQLPLRFCHDHTVFRSMATGRHAIKEFLRER
jgi:hypothetical protein